MLPALLLESHIIEHLSDYNHVFIVPVLSLSVRDLTESDNRIGCLFHTVSNYTFAERTCPLQIVYL